MLKKTIKISIIVLLILLVIWGIIFVINVVRFLNYKAPILYWQLIINEVTAEYDCFGYTIRANIFSKGVGQMEMLFLKKKLFKTKLLEDKFNYYEDEKGIKRFY